MTTIKSGGGGYEVLGIDYGDSRIGIAISDPLGWTAQALETITWRSDVEVPLKGYLNWSKNME